MKVAVSCGVVGIVMVSILLSGNAATLLDGRRTAHYAFKLPPKLCRDDASSVCNVLVQSSTGKLMQECTLIIWGLASMSHQVCVEALDRTMRDLHQKNIPMGGHAVLFFGDLCQILPVVECGSRADKANESLTRS